MPPMRRVERLRVPEHFQARLTRAGGLNRYGQPCFRLAWAQTETTRQGGRWEAYGEWFQGYRDILLGDGLPHWILLQWADAGKSIAMPWLVPESDGAFYAANECPATGLQLLGGYPYRGSYQIALQLMAKWVEKQDGIPSIRIHAFPLSTDIIDMMVPIIKATRELSVKAKVKDMDDQRQKDDDELAYKVEDAYKDSQLSASARSSQWIADKARAIENSFNAAMILKMRSTKVFQTNQRLGA